MCVICRGEYKLTDTELDCSCDDITSIPELPNLKRLECYDCPKLTTIPKLPNLEWLNCSWCVKLTTIPELPKLRYLYCYSCILLITIPKSIELTNLMCSNCRLLYIPIKLRLKFNSKNILIGRKIKRRLYETTTQKRFKNRHLTRLISKYLY